MWVGAPHRPPHPVDLPHPVPPPPPPGMLLTPTLPLNILFFRESPPARCPQHPYPWDAQAPASVLSLCLSVCLSRPPPQGPTHVPSRAIGAKPPSPHHDPSLDGAGGRPTPHQAPPPPPPIILVRTDRRTKGRRAGRSLGGGGGQSPRAAGRVPNPGMPSAGDRCESRPMSKRALPDFARTLPAPAGKSRGCPPPPPVGACPCPCHPPVGGGSASSLPGCDTCAGTRVHTCANTRVCTCVCPSVQETAPACRRLSLCPSVLVSI